MTEKNERMRAALRDIEGRAAAAPEKEKGGALKHCGYEAEEYENGDFIMGLTTPYEGATIHAQLFRTGVSRREWEFSCRVENNRGIGWHITGNFEDCGRNVAKAMLRSQALELRRLYCHRGQKIRKRAIARAKAAEQAAE